MKGSVLESSSTQELDEIPDLDAMSTELDYTSAEKFANTPGSFMEVLLPPSNDSPNTKTAARLWLIPDGVVQAEAEFYRKLPSLLKSDLGKWIYIKSDGNFKVFLSQDEAEIAAEDDGIPHDQFVIRFVSEFEQPELS